MERDELIIGYAPAFRSATEWRHTFRQLRAGDSGTVTRRVIIEHVARPHSRLLVDVAECIGPDEAASTLKNVRADANFEVTEGPERFGLGAFSFPATNAQSLHFRKSNLMIWVYSCGRDAVSVAPWADTILGDLDAPQRAEPGSGMTITPVDGGSQPRHLSVKYQWDLGEWAWRKFKATGGTLARSKKDESLLFWQTTSSAFVTGWAIEPGRATYAGRFPPER